MAICMSFQEFSEKRKQTQVGGSGYFDTQLEGYLNILDLAPYTIIRERVAKKAAWSALA